MMHHIMCMCLGFLHTLDVCNGCQRSVSTQFDESILNNTTWPTSVRLPPTRDCVTGTQIYTMCHLPPWGRTVRVTTTTGICQQVASSCQPKLDWNGHLGHLQPGTDILIQILKNMYYTWSLQGMLHPQYSQDCSCHNGAHLVNQVMAHC